MCGCFFRVAAVFFPNKKPTLQLVQSRFKTLCFLFNFPRQLVPRTISEFALFSSFQNIYYRPFTFTVNGQFYLFSKRQNRSSSPFGLVFPFISHFFHFISLFIVRIVIPESFLTSQVFLTPIIFFSSLSFLFSLTISHHSGVFMRSCEGTDDNKESFFFFLFFFILSQKYRDF